MPRYSLYRERTQVQVIRHYCKWGMPERRERRLAGAPKSGNEIFVSGLSNFWWMLHNHLKKILVSFRASIYRTGCIVPGIPCPSRLTFWFWEFVYKRNCGWRDRWRWGCTLTSNRGGCEHERKGGFRARAYAGSWGLRVGRDRDGEAPLLPVIAGRDRGTRNRVTGSP